MPSVIPHLAHEQDAALSIYTAGERYVSSSPHAAVVRDLVGATVLDGESTSATDAPLRTAGAPVAEADSVQAVAADRLVVDTERDPLYGDGVQHGLRFSPADSASRKGRSRGDAVATSAVTQRLEARIGQERAVLPQKPGTAGGDGLTCCTASAVAAESFRLSRLSRWQEQR